MAVFGRAFLLALLVCTAVASSLEPEDMSASLMMEESCDGEDDTCSLSLRQLRGEVAGASSLTQEDADVSDLVKEAGKQNCATAGEVCGGWGGHLHPKCCGGFTCEHQILGVGKCSGSSGGSGYHPGGNSQTDGNHAMKKGWMFLYNKFTRECLSVGEHKNGKQDFLAVNPCGAQHTNQKFRLNGNDKLVVKKRHGGNDCVDLNNKGQIVLKDCTRSKKQEKWTWKSSNGVDGWLSTTLDHGVEACIGIHGRDTSKGTLVGWSKCDFKNSDQVWQVTSKPKH